MGTSAHQTSRYLYFNNKSQNQFRMRKIFLSLAFIGAGISFGQKDKYPNLEIYKAGEFPSENFITCANVWMSDLNCWTYDCTGDLIELSLSNCDPEGSDSLKNTTIDAIAADIDSIISTASCNKGKSYYMQLGEGIFIKKADQLTGNKYLKKAWKLNLERFREMFGQRLTEAFPNTKFYVTEWGW